MIGGFHFIPHKALDRRMEIMNRRKNEIFVFDKDIPGGKDNLKEASFTFIDIASNYENNVRNIRGDLITVYKKKYG